MRNDIIACAKHYGADLVGFAPADRFPKDDPIFTILPNVKTVIVAYRLAGLAAQAGLIAKVRGGQEFEGGVYGLGTLGIKAFFAVKNGLALWVIL